MDSTRRNKPAAKYKSQLVKKHPAPQNLNPRSLRNRKLCSPSEIQTNSINQQILQLQQNPQFLEPTLYLHPLTINPNSRHLLLILAHVKAQVQGRVQVLGSIVLILWTTKPPWNKEYRFLKNIDYHGSNLPSWS